MYAIIKTGGKQYKVAENQVIKLEKLAANEGDVIQLDQVLALGNGDQVTLGAPLVAGATVSAEVLAQAKDDKVLIFKKKRRQNYRRKKGHRQQITVVRILDVSGKGEKKVHPKKEKPVVAKAEVSEEVIQEATKKTAKKPAAKKTASKTGAKKTNTVKKS